MEAISSNLVFSWPHVEGPGTRLVFGETLLVTADGFVTLKNDVSVAALILQPLKADIAALLNGAVSVAASVNVPIALMGYQAIEAFTQDANALVLFFLQRNARTWDVYGQDREILISGQDRQMSVYAQDRHITLE